MRYFLALLPLFLCSCASIKFVTLDRGHIVSELNEPVNIVGNPIMTCQEMDNPGHIVEGYFMYQENTNTFLIDVYGKKFIFVKNPICTLGLNSLNN